MLYRLTTAFLVLVSFFGQAQKDSADLVPMFSAHVSGQVPFADLSKRFGPNFAAGGSFMLKTRKNYIFGIESFYMYGRNVKEDVLSQLRTAEGYVVDNEGYPADLRISERGLALHITAGKIFILDRNNRNSGLMVTAGIGGLQHRINLYDAQFKVAAVKEERSYGYDRLSLGISLSQFVGYMYLSNNRLLNFYFGVESYQAFTKSVRKLNYDTGLPDTAKRLDILTGLRVGWILPIYRKKPNEYYFN
jgi:hypothetical protein